MIVTVRTNLAREHLFVVYLFLNPFHQVCDVLCVCVFCGREGGRDGGREREEGVREGGSEGGSEGGREREEGGREREEKYTYAGFCSLVRTMYLGAQH